MQIVIRYIRKLLYILSGYFIFLKDLILRRQSEKSYNRLQICKQCKHNVKGICKKCGCIIKVKVKVDFLEDSEGISIDGCPERKW